MINSLGVYFCCDNKGEQKREKSNSLLTVHPLNA